MRLERELKNKLRELKKVAKNGEKVTFRGFQSGKFAAYSYAVAGAGDFGIDVLRHALLKAEGPLRYGGLCGPFSEVLQYRVL